MKNKMESRGSEDSRRGFFQRCLGTGAVLAAAPPGHAGRPGPSASCRGFRPGTGGV
jgi:hypothetical protein